MGVMVISVKNKFVEKIHSPENFHPILLYRESEKLEHLLQASDVLMREFKLLMVNNELINIFLAADYKSNAGERFKRA